ncbi:MAG: NADPH:quinone oxidoreductase family protein [Acuticoccus sp.]
MVQPVNDRAARAPAEVNAWRSDASGRAAMALSVIPCPEPGPREALVQVKAAALNFSDLLMAEGAYQVRPPAPFTPGQEVAGVVLAAGAESGLLPGARIAAKVEWGGFAEAAVVRGDTAIALPDTVDFATGAALPVSYTTAMVGLVELGRVAAGEVVLVHAGAGALGIAATQIACARGARVIATASAADKRALARRQGAEVAVDYTAPDWRGAVEAAVGKYAVDVVFDSVGGAVTETSLRLMRRDGRLLVAGFASGTIAKIPANLLLVKRISAIGVYWNHDVDGAMLARVQRAIGDDLAAGRIAPVIDVRQGLAALPGAMADLAARRTAGKVVLTLGGGA